MKFKIGDKVSFIDEVGGGEISAIIDSRLVKVKTDDGFEIPVLGSNLIIDQRAQPENKPDLVVPIVKSKDNPIKEDFISDINPFRKTVEADGVYLGYEPHEQHWILTGDIDIMLANNTNYELLYSLFMQNQKKYIGVDFSSVPPKSKIVIETIAREDIDDWKTGYIQLLFHSDEPEIIYLPVHSVIDVKSARFFKEGSYTDNTLFNGKAIVISVAKLESIPKISDDKKELKDDSYITESIASVSRKKQPIDKYRSSQGEAIVDLHIGELVDNILGLSSKDMLAIQIDTFNKLLKNAIENEYNKVTFIHGVGNGVLKSAIIKELENYDGLENAMASIAKFGVGAIDISINNK